MTEKPVQTDSEISREDSIMGSGQREDIASRASSPTGSLGHHPHSPPSMHNPKEIWKKGGRMFSVLLAVNLVLLACTLVSSAAFNQVAVHDYDVFFLLTVMMLICIAWTLFYLIVTTKRQDAILYKDSHAGPVWLRDKCGLTYVYLSTPTMRTSSLIAFASSTGGLVLFAIFTLVMDVFKTGYYSSFYNCLSAIKIIYPIVQAVFVIIQTAFTCTWTLPGEYFSQLGMFSSALVPIPLPLRASPAIRCSYRGNIPTFFHVNGCGLMLTLTTNLAVWMSAVTDESVHKSHTKFQNVTEGTHRWIMKAGTASDAIEGCSCTSEICKIFQSGYFWLYPFNIEYSLFASAMLYVMWKNVGRLIDHHTHHIHHLKFRLFRRTFFVGIILGLLILVSGLAVLIVYEVQVNASGQPDKKNEALIMYYTFNIVCLSLMSLVCIGGSIVYRFDKRDMDHHKNPTRTLDMALLLGAAVGQYAISYYSIVAVVASTPRDAISALNLTYSLLMIAQHTFQNIFIIEGLHRQPPEDDHKIHPHQKDLYGLTFVNINAVSLRVPESSSALPSPLPHGQGAVAIQPSDVVQSIIVPKKVKWRRKFLKEISLFLLLCNVILWIMPAFGARPQFDNDKELNFYGYSMWAAIVDICLPFGIFYRMHAVASLLEVYIMS
ncbi:Otopetrin-2 [Chelonia mydas]|uniref:Otopetrin-2 n=1 Tax=Chelonia mydas TaxID=8469 RepID=M7BS34_CHEMY|nr:Otopetrin-2 [Chelonia mydas]